MNESRKPGSLIEVNRLKYATTVKHLSASDLRKLPVPVLEREDQAEVGRTLDRSAKAARTASLELNSLSNRLAEYRDALITEAVTGKLDVSKLSESQMDESFAAVREGERPEVLST